MGRVLALAIACAVAAAGAPAVATGTVRVAVIDSGIEPTHPEFRAGQVVAWHDFVNDAASPYDDHGHGTAVSSLVAGRTLGVHPDAELIVAKVLDEQNRLPTWTPVVDAIRWAVEEGADVINVSIWSTVPQPTSSLTIGAAIDDAREAGVLVVWIAGNGAETQPGFPSPYTATVLVGASSPRALVVGAASADGRRADFSQRDPELLAHGADVLVAWAGGGYGVGGGTSFAAPWVAGAAARLLSAGAPRDPDWLEWVLLHASRDDPDVIYLDEGYGFLGDAELAAAEAVARGDASVPEMDERDLWHIATTVPRTAQTATLPGGILPT